MPAFLSLVGRLQRRALLVGQENEDELRTCARNLQRAGVGSDASRLRVRSLKPRPQRVGFCSYSADQKTCPDFSPGAWVEVLGRPLFWPPDYEVAGWCAHFGGGIRRGQSHAHWRRSVHTVDRAGGAPLTAQSAPLALVSLLLRRVADFNLGSGHCRWMCCPLAVERAVRRKHRPAAVRCG